MCFHIDGKKTLSNRPKNQQKSWQKNKRMLTVALVLACCFCLSGCGLFDLFKVSSAPDIEEVVKEAAERQEREEKAPEEKIQIVEAEEFLPKEPETQDYLHVEENQVEEKESSFSKSDMDRKREQIGLSEADIIGLQESQHGNYYFGQLGSLEKVIYVEMYQILALMEEEILLSTTDISLLPRVYQAVINDHPEFFYLNGYTYTRFMQQDAIKYITFSGRYLYDKPEVERRQAAIDRIVDEKMAELVRYDLYETVKAVYEYLILSTEYSMESPDNQNICSVFLDRKSVCNGYAKAAQYLLNNYGIRCIIVNGTAAGNPHAWNIVEMYGEYYHMDVTWGDPSYYASEGEEKGGVPDIDYSYLNVTDEEISKNHSVDNMFAIPGCHAIQDNYFVREGRYLYGYDAEKIKWIFDTAKGQGESMVCLKAADRQAYQEIYTNLIGEQKIFDYFGTYQNDGEYRIAYSGNEDLYTISFWE